MVSGRWKGHTQVVSRTWKEHTKALNGRWRDTLGLKVGDGGAHYGGKWEIEWHTGVVRWR